MNFWSRIIMAVLSFLAIFFFCWIGATQFAVYFLPKELWIVVAVGGMFIGIMSGMNVYIRILKKLE